MLVITRLVRVTHDLGGDDQSAPAPPDSDPSSTEIMAGPDEPAMTSQEKGLRTARRASMAL
ncbi:hypothetical protein [Phenylobacterium sp.]|uniref:hypothetical protein n=1 Tax=Phenylobacterium sp. TaxID=1871053 RepID=UPI00286C2624|nr:hypothetical protein [Phenylobacterium sp.]